VSARAQRWNQDFDVYFTRVEEKPASFVIDLNAGKHAPVESHPVRLVVRVPMKMKRPDGLRHKDELDALAALEDRVVPALEQKLDALYVGRVVVDQKTILYFYLPREYDGDLGALVGGWGAYTPTCVFDDDPEWQGYTGFLAPDAYDHNTIMNRRLLAIFEEHGDQVQQPREIDHYATFDDAASARAAADQLRAAGFRVDAPDAKHGLQFHREDAPAGADEWWGGLL
jgi:hypothetical protein